MARSIGPAQAEAPPVQTESAAAESEAPAIGLTAARRKRRRPSQSQAAWPKRTAGNVPSARSRFQSWAPGRVESDHSTGSFHHGRGSGGSARPAWGQRHRGRYRSLLNRRGAGSRRTLRVRTRNTTERLPTTSPGRRVPDQMLAAERSACAQTGRTGYECNYANQTVARMSTIGLLDERIYAHAIRGAIRWSRRKLHSDAGVARLRLAGLHQRDCCAVLGPRGKSVTTVPLRKTAVTRGTAVRP